MASETSNKFKYLVMKKVIDLSADTCKIILMASGFVFNKASHHVYADVSASELPTASGYTSGGATLTTATLTEDDTNNVGKCTWDNPQWTATGTIVARGAIIFDDTVSSPVADPIVAYIDFGSNQTVLNGGVFTISGVSVAIS